MIDTVDLYLSYDQFDIFDIKVFDGKNTLGVKKRFSSEELFIKKERDKIVKQGRYFPCMNLKIKSVLDENGKRKKVVEGLKIQVSLPKLLFGTNIFEIGYIHRDEIYKKLIKCLGEIGIRTTREQLEKAILKRIAFSKIIKIPDHYGDARRVLKLLQDFDYKKSAIFQINYYGRRKQCFYIRFNNKTQTQAFVIYDKIDEVEFNGKTFQEVEIKKHKEDGRLRNNVIKIELTLQKKQSVDSVLRRILGVKKKNFFLDDVLKEEVSKQALLEVFNHVFNDINIFLLSAGEMRENLLEHKLQEAEIGMKKRAWLIYLVNKGVKFGVLETKEQLKKGLTKSTYKRSIKALRETTKDLLEIKGLRGDVVDYLREKLEEFKIISG